MLVPTLASEDGEGLLARLKTALALPLPGISAQLRMLPPHRPYASPEAASYRPAAVLLLLYPRGESLVFPLILRTRAFGSHRGQVALPGGALEAGESAEEAALREAGEEIGLEPEGAAILGRLTPLPVPPSRYLVTPVLAHSETAPKLSANSAEVAELFEVGVEALLAAEPRLRALPASDGQLREVPVFELGGRLVWGATAMILSEFRALLAASIVVRR